MMTAIFLLVVIAVLAGYIVSLSSEQHTGAALDLQGARAYQAAQAGLQWGAHRALNGSCANDSFLLSGELSGFAVTVNCVVFPYTENTAARNILRVTATGCQPPSGGTCPGVPGNYSVERQLEATIDQ